MLHYPLPPAINTKEIEGLFLLPPPQGNVGGGFDPRLNQGGGQQGGYPQNVPSQEGSGGGQNTGNFPASRVFIGTSQIPLNPSAGLSPTNNITLQGTTTGVRDREGRIRGDWVIPSASSHIPDRPPGVVDIPRKYIMVDQFSSGASTSLIYQPLTYTFPPPVPTSGPQATLSGSEASSIVPMETNSSRGSPPIEAVFSPSDHSHSPPITYPSSAHSKTIPSQSHSQTTQYATLKSQPSAGSVHAKSLKNTMFDTQDSRGEQYDKDVSHKFQTATNLLVQYPFDPKGKLPWASMDIAAREEARKDCWVEYRPVADKYNNSTWKAKPTCPSILMRDTLGQIDPNVNWDKETGFFKMEGKDGDWWMAPVASARDPRNPPQWPEYPRDLTLPECEIRNEINEFRNRRNIDRSLTLMLWGDSGAPRLQSPLKSWILDTARYPGCPQLKKIIPAYLPGARLWDIVHANPHPLPPADIMVVKLQNDLMNLFFVDRETKAQRDIYLKGVQSFFFNLKSELKTIQQTHGGMSIIVVGMNPINSTSRIPKAHRNDINAEQYAEDMDTHFRAMVDALCDVYFVSVMEEFHKYAPLLNPRNVCSGAHMGHVANLFITRAIRLAIFKIYAMRNSLGFGSVSNFQIDTCPQEQDQIKYAETMLALKY